MDEQTDMERNAKRTGQKEREDMERYKESSTQVLVLSEKEREVSLVLTHTERTTKGEMLLCCVKVKQQEKQDHPFIQQPHSDPYNEYMEELYIPDGTGWPP